MVASTISIELRNVIEEDLPIFFQHQLDLAAIQMADFPGRDWDSFAFPWKKILQDADIIIRAILFNGRLAGNIVSFEQEVRR